MAREREYSPLFILIAIIAMVAALYLAKQILLPIALAVLLSFLLTPLANRLERFKIPRVASVLLVVAFVFSILGILGWIVAAQVFELRHDLSTYRTNIIQKIREIRPSSSTVEEVTKTIEDVGKELSGATDENRSRDIVEKRDDAQEPGQPSLYDWLPLLRDGKPALEGQRAGEEQAVEVRVVEMPPSPLQQIQDWLGPFLEPITTAGMVVVLMLFMLMDRENQRNRLIQLFGTANLHSTTEALHDATQRIGQYLRMQFLINATYGVVVGIGLWLFGVPGAIMWGVFGFALRFLPYLGPILAAALPILVSLADSEGWTKPLLVMAMYIVYELFLNNVAEPLLYGGSIGVSTVGVIISALFWTWLWGPIGLILAMPMTVCLVVLARYLPQLRFIIVILADQPPLSPAERVYQRLLAFDYNEPLAIAREHLKSASIIELYDDVVIPALTLAEQDRHAGLLSSEQEAYVQEVAEDLIEELGEEAATAPKTGDSFESGASNDREQKEERPQTRILCIPLRDEADQLTSRMLAQLLISEGFDAQAGSAGALTSEMVEQVAQLRSDIVVICVLPPIRPRDSRLLWRRLRQRYPELPIVVGYWTGKDQKESLAQPEKDESSRVVSTLQEASAFIRSKAVQLHLAKAV